MEKQLFLFLLIALFISCKQRVSVGGAILDEETRQPVKAVYISQKELTKNTFVDDLDS